MGDSRVSMFFKNSDPGCKDRKARYLGCALSGNLPQVGDQRAASAPNNGMSAASSLKQQHQPLGAIEVT